MCGLLLALTLHSQIRVSMAKRNDWEEMCQAFVPAKSSATQKYVFPIHGENISREVTFTSSKDAHKLAAYACGDDSFQNCREQVIAYLNYYSWSNHVKGLAPEAQPKCIVYVQTQVGPFEAFCGDDPALKAYQFCKGHVLGYSCVQALVKEALSQLERLEECSCFACPRRLLLPPVSALASTSSSQLPSDEHLEAIISHLAQYYSAGFSFLEHNDVGTGSCRISFALSERFGSRVSSACFGAKTDAERVTAVISTRKGSPLEVYASPDTVDVQACLETCSFLNAVETFEAMVASAHKTLVNGREQDVKNMVARAMERSGEEMQIEVHRVGSFDLWELRTLKSKKVGYHRVEYMKREGLFEIWIAEQGSAVYAVSKRDNAPEKRHDLGLCLNTILLAQPLPRSRQKLLELFFDQCARDASYPWDFLYLQSNLKSGSDARESFHLGLGYLYTVVKLHDCAWNVGDPIQSYHNCIISSYLYKSAEDAAPARRSDSFEFDSVLESISKDFGAGSISLLEHAADGTKCEVSYAAAERFGNSVHAACFGASSLSSSRGYVLTFEKGSMENLGKAPDVVHVQTCLGSCAAKLDAMSLRWMLASSLTSYIQFSSRVSEAQVTALLHAAANDSIVVDATRLSPRIWKLTTRSAHKLANHHYMATEEKWKDYYHVYISENPQQRVGAIRLSDGKRIPFATLGLSLNTLLWARPDAPARLQLHRWFYGLGVTEDMAPWNMLFSSGNGVGLTYVDAQTYKTPHLDSNYMYTVMRLLDCSWEEAERILHPTRSFHACIRASWIK